MKNKLGMIKDFTLRMKGMQQKGIGNKILEFTKTVRNSHIFSPKQKRCDPIVPLDKVTYGAAKIMLTSLR